MTTTSCGSIVPASATKSPMRRSMRSANPRSESSSPAASSYVARSSTFVARVGARGEQFELDCPDAAADLEHARAAHVAAQLEQAARRAAQAVAAKAACVTAACRRPKNFS